MRYLYRKFIAVMLTASLVAAPLEPFGITFSKTAYAMVQSAPENPRVSRATESNASEQQSKADPEIRDEDSEIEDEDSEIRDEDSEIEDEDSEIRDEDSEIEDEDHEFEDEDAGAENGEIDLTPATASNAVPDKKPERNPFGLEDEDLPASYEELFGASADLDENNLLSLALEADQEETPEVSVRSNAVSSGDFVIQYTSVAMKQKEFKVTSDMQRTVNLLTTPYSVELEDGTYHGFRVVSLMLEITQDDETLTFYADKIVSGNFYINVRMELSGGKRFAEGLWYTDDVDDESGTWNSCRNAGFASGRFAIRLTQPYGAYVAKIADAEQTDGNNKALIIVQTGDESLQTGPEEDAEALRSALTRTREFRDEDVTVMEVPQDTDEDYKTQIWNWIDEAAGEERLTLIAYTGHGNYLDDGTSELSLGGENQQNTIHAVELKQHVAKLSGKVVLAFDCCFSGGMIMPTELGPEDLESQTDVDAALKQAQKKADDSLNTFVKNFRKASAAAADTSGDKAGKSLSYYIYAAASSYETSIQKQTGGELINAICHALGYDRNDGAYNIYAADTDASYWIDAGELSAYIRRTCTVATPSIYPSEGKETLFSYGEEDGIPAVLSMTTEDGRENITVQKDNSIQVKVKVKNYSNAPVTFDAMMGEVLSAAMDIPGSYETVAAYSGDKLIYHENVNRHTLAASSEGTFTLRFQADKEDAAWLKQGGRYLVRIWGTENTDAACYAISDFYISSAQLADAPDRDALELRKPAYAEAAAEAVEVSAMVPIHVAFDREPVEKQGYAACTLTARYLDLGETDGIQSEGDQGYYADNGALMLNGNPAADAENADNWKEIYSDVRPAYTRRDILGDSETTVTGSTYNYEWDVTGLKKDHYYVLQIVCSYDNAPEDDMERSVLTFLKVVDPSDQLPHVISEHNISMNEAAPLSGGGIAMGGSWLTENSTAEAATKRLVKYWNSNSYAYDGDQNRDIHYSVADENSSGWYEITENGTPREMDANETFQSGHDYANRLVMQIDAGYNAIFGSWTDVRVGGHSLYEGNGLERKLSEDKKTLTVYILHKKVGTDTSGFHVYLAGTKTPVTAGTKLAVGDEIDVYKADGWSLYTPGGSGLQSVSGSYDGFERFRIRQDQTEIQFLLYHKLNFMPEDDDDCACASLLFEHEISGRTDEVGRVSDPAKTFYPVGSSSLDLTGSEITLYDKDRKENRMDLQEFLDTYKTKLFYTLDNENFTEWTNDNLSLLGSWELYVSYNDAYYRAFSIRVGYEQGEAFALNGKMTGNQNGDAGYLSEKESRNAVLFVTSSFEEADSRKGVITCEHDLRLREDGIHAEDYRKLYPADGATISYLLPYPEFKEMPYSGSAYDYTVVDADRNVPVSIEKKEDGLWVTAGRNGEFQVQYFLDIGGDDGGMVVPDDENDEKGDSASGSDRSSERSTTAVRTQGSWQSGIYRQVPQETAGAVCIDGDYYVMVPEEKMTGGDFGNAAANEGLRLFYRFRMNNGEDAAGWRLILWQGTDHWFYFGNDGFMRTGWVQDQGKWYYLRADGTMAVGWLLDHGSWYYLGTNGAMATGWVQDQGKGYYLQPDGRWIG